MKTSEQINEIAKAMSLAQGEMKPASKSTENPFFKSKYSSLAQVMDAIREPFAKNNLCVFQDVSSTELGVAVSTRVCHSSGQWIEFGPMLVPLTKKDAQGVGSATSYGKRYSLSAAVGVVSELEDDDGEAAMNRNVEKEKKEKPKKETPEALTGEQRKIMSDLADQCDPAYIEKVFTRLEQKGIYGFEGVTQDLFELIIGGMKKNIEVYKGK